MVKKKKKVKRLCLTELILIIAHSKMKNACATNVSKKCNVKVGQTRKKKLQTVETVTKSRSSDGIHVIYFETNFYELNYLCYLFILMYNYSNDTHLPSLSYNAVLYNFFPCKRK